MLGFSSSPRGTQPPRELNTVQTGALAGAGRTKNSEAGVPRDGQTDISLGGQKVGDCAGP